MRCFSEKGLKTRQTILDAAMDLFHAKGFQGTSVDEILAASCTGKSQFYHYFKSKEDLIHQLLEQIHDIIVQGGLPEHQPIKSWEELEHWFHRQVALQERYGFNRGCPIATIGNEASEEDQILREDIERIFQALAQNPERFFTTEKEAGRLVDEASPGCLALYCVSSMQGGFLISKMQQGPAAIQNAIRHTIRYLSSYRM